MFVVLGFLKLTLEHTNERNNKKKFVEKLKTFVNYLKRKTSPPRIVDGLPVILRLWSLIQYQNQCQIPKSMFCLICQCWNFNKSCGAAIFRSFHFVEAQHHGSMAAGSQIKFCPTLIMAVWQRDCKVYKRAFIMRPPCHTATIEVG